MPFSGFVHTFTLRGFGVKGSQEALERPPRNGRGWRGWGPVFSAGHTSVGCVWGPRSYVTEEKW